MKLKNLKTALILILILVSGNQLFAQDGEVTIDQDSDITKLLEYKKDVKTVDLYKIQLDFGSRSKAESLKQSFQNTFAEWLDLEKYDTPVRIDSFC